MRANIQLAKLVKSELIGRRGLIRDIVEYTGLERHTVSTLLRNKAKYISIDCVSRLCDYLVHRHGVDPAILPGALFGKEQDGFWTMLAGRKEVSFCLATRTHPEWPDTEYVMANDAHLQGVLTAEVSALDVSTARKLDQTASSLQSGPTNGAVLPDELHNGTSQPWSNGVHLAPKNEDVKRTFLHPQLVPAPRRERNGDDDSGSTFNEGKHRAAEIYATFQRHGDAPVLFSLGSVKVNGVLEVLSGHIFRTEPFESQDHVNLAKQRACPFYFRYRAHDPAPKSLCGGTRLAKRHRASQPGIYYETEKGHWDCCPCEPGSHDVAFVLYAYRPPIDELQLACGGFSGLASRYLAERFVSVASQLWKPQYRSPELEVGLFLVTFDIRKATRPGSNAEYNHRVIRVHEDVLARRLDKTFSKRAAKT